MVRRLQVVIAQEDGAYTASVPALDLHATGRSPDAARDALRRAIRLAERGDTAFLGELDALIGPPKVARPRPLARRIVAIEEMLI